MEDERCDGIKFRLANIEKNIEKILKLLLGNGDDGIITETALLKQKVEDLPSPSSLKFFAAVGGGIVTATGLVLFLIVHSVKSLWGS